MRTTYQPETAARLLSTGQVILGIAIASVAIVVAAAFGPVLLLKVAVGLAVAFYIVFVGFKFVIWHAAARPAEPHGELPATGDPDLPRYTVLLPLYGEANILGQLVTGLSGLRYPAEKLQILLLEKDDHETQAAAAAMDLPPQFEVLTAPEAGPRAKPKACNYGYTHATGDIVTIFDAEDRPEPDQLLRAWPASALRRHGAAGSAACRRGWSSGTRAAAGSAPSTGLSTWPTSAGCWAACPAGPHPAAGRHEQPLRPRGAGSVSEANGEWEFADDEGHPVTVRGPWDRTT